MNMDSKSFLASKTIQGIVLVVIGLVLQILETRGITFLGSADDLVQVILQVVGSIYAVYGRFKVETKLGV